MGVDDDDHGPASALLKGVIEEQDVLLDRWKPSQDIRHEAAFRRPQAAISTLKQRGSRVDTLGPLASATRSTLGGHGCSKCGGRSGGGNAGGVSEPKTLDVGHPEAHYHA